MRDPGRAALSKSDMEKLRAVRRYRKITRKEIRAWAKAFTRKELAPKWRRRHLIDPLINELFIDGDFEKISLPTLRDIRVGLKKFVIQFDFASWYDQFLLDPDVQPYFTIKTKEGLFVHCTLPMGFRPSCLVGQRTSDILATLSNADRLFLAIYIDNILISADTEEECLAAAREFVERCKTAGAILNDADVPLEQRLQTKFEFLGVAYNLIDRELQHSDKTMDKLVKGLEIVRDDSQKFTFRRVAAVFGLLFWAQSVLPVDISKYFHALKFYREHMNIDDTEWNRECPAFPLNVRRELSAWFQEAIAAPPQPLLPKAKGESEGTIYTDASAYGWGAIFFSNEGVKTAGGPWSSDDLALWNVESSVAAEPLAFTKAISTFCSVHTRHVQVYTDHMSLTYPVNRGYGKAYSYNYAIRQIKECFPNLQITMCFIKGEDNVIADGISRGRGLEEFGVDGMKLPLRAHSGEDQGAYVDLLPN